MNKHYNLLNLHVLCLTVLGTFLSVISYSQSASIIFVNNKYSDAAETVDVKVVDFSSGDVIASNDGLGRMASSVVLSVPSETILDFEWYEAGTTNLLFTSSTQVLDSGGEYLGVFSGATSNTSYSQANIFSSNSTDGTSKYRLLNGITGLGQVDLFLRNEGVQIADDVNAISMTFPTSTIDAVNDIIDLTPGDDNGNGLCAYTWNGLDYSGQTIGFILSGTISVPNLFVVEADGTITELVKVDPINSINEITLESILEFEVLGKDVYLNNSSVNLIQGTLYLYDLSGRLIESISGLTITANSRALMPIEGMSVGTIISLITLDTNERVSTKFLGY